MSETAALWFVGITQAIIWFQCGWASGKAKGRADECRDRADAKRRERDETMTAELEKRAQR